MTILLRALAFGLAVAATPALPQTARIEDRATFDFTLRGFRAGTFSLVAAQTGTDYVATGSVRSAGLAALLKSFSYAGRAEGTVSKGRYRPRAYAEDADSGKKRLQRQILYRGGKPTRVVTIPEREPKPYDVAPGSMAGSVDPMTGLYAALRDVDAGAECRVDVVVYDGTESARLRLANAARQGDTVICAGEYRRLAGYSPKELNERTTFPFTLTYARVAGGRMRVVLIALDTLLGPATMVRR